MVFLNRELKDREEKIKREIYYFLLLFITIKNYLINGLLCLKKIQINLKNKKCRKQRPIVKIGIIG